MSEAFTGEIEKTEWVIASHKFGKRRIWKDNGGYFFVVGNVPYRRAYDDDDIQVYKADRVRGYVKRANGGEEH